LRTYEALYIVKPDLTDDEIQTVAKEVDKLVTDNGGAIVRSEIWGKRKLAYKVKHCTEGCYVLLRFQAEADFVARLEGYFRLSDHIIRFLVVYFDERTLRLEEEQIRRNEADIRSGANRGGPDRDRDERRGRSSGDGGADRSERRGRPSGNDDED
jgi:small subunit ribosomal protein S6